MPQSADEHSTIDAVGSVDRAGNGIVGRERERGILRAQLRSALDGVGWSVTSTYFGGLVLLDVITVALAWLLFPYLWRD